MTKYHTGDELALMLQGKKPLAMFYYRKLGDDRDILPWKAFAPHVAQGRFLLEEFDAPLPPNTDPIYAVTYVFYALASEAWRIPAIKIAILAQCHNIQTPDEGIDRIIGMLLGYDRRDIDIWIRDGLAKGVYARKNDVG